MIHGLKYLLLPVKAFEKLPFHANMPNPETDELDWGREFWLKSFYKTSSCSLVKGLVSVGGELSSVVVAALARPSLSFAGHDGFQSAGLP